MTLEKLQAIIADQLSVNRDDIKPETDLKADLKADSLDIMEILMNIEDEFGIEIDDEAAKGFKTIGDVVVYLDGLQG